MSKFLECKRMMDHMENERDSRICNVSDTSIIELPIDEWYGYVPPDKLRT